MAGESKGSVLELSHPMGFLEPVLSNIDQGDKHNNRISLMESMKYDTSTRKSLQK